MSPELNPIVIALLIIVLLFFALILLTALISKIYNFCRELNCVNTEIGRTEGAERQYWKDKKRRLWLSLLPFCRK